MSPEVAASFARLGPFGRIWFRTSALEPEPGHLPLLHLRDCDRSIADVRAALVEPGASDAILRMLAEANWRPNLVAAVAIGFLPRDGRYADALWEALDAASWVSPQLAVVLWIHDARFAERATARLGTGCLTTARNCESAAGRPNAKAATALHALLPPDATRTQALADLLAADVDGGGRIAIAWRDALERCSGGVP